MFEYIQKFNSLPQDVRERVTGAEAMKILETLESAYNVELAAIIMRVMVKEINLVDLPKFFIFEYNMDGTVAQKLANELEDKIFSRASDFLGLGEKKGVSIDEVDINKEKEKISKNIADVQGSTFFFSSEDEEEVRELAKELGGHEENEDKKIEELEIKLNAAIDEIKLSFSSEILADRMRNVIKTYLKNIRNRLQTRETLTKPTNIGGLGFDELKADRALKVADKYKQDIHSDKPSPAPVKMKVPEDDEAKKQASPADVKGKEEKDKFAQSGVRDMDYDFSALKKKDAPAAPKTSATPSVSTPSPLDLKTEPGNSPSAPAQKSKEDPPKTPLNIVRNAQTGGKVKMEDVKRVPKLTGPVEELKNMDLVNFRRLSEDPKRATDKIMEKLQYLEDDSFKKRMDGVKAWRQSPINRLYLEIGHSSIVENKPIDAIISERAGKGDDFFTKEEFEAIMELNKKLRF